MSELGKPFLKKIRWEKKPKKTENQCQNAARENRKPLCEICNFDSNKKPGPEWAVNELGKLFRKNPIQKIEKTVKIKVKLPHVNKKPPARKRIFVQTPYSVWTNVKRKKSVRRRNKKNIAGQVLTYNSKNFHWLNRKLDLERTMNGLEKPFRKKSYSKNWKNSKNQSEIAACEQNH